MEKPKQLVMQFRESLNAELAVKEEMNSAASECGLSRDQIVDGMNRTALRFGINLMKGNKGDLSLDTLEKWLNPNAQGYLPSIRALMVFCAVVDGSERVLSAMAEPLGCRIVGRKDALLLDWAKEFQRAKEAQRRMRRLERQL
ncbi:MAG: hypothetical protein ABFD98_15805 [Syntrophobacteraceae bacterium]|nr:hypothetical protein [Desulfobacteraceae bacterium]